MLSLHENTHFVMKTNTYPYVFQPHHGLKTGGHIVQGSLLAGCFPLQVWSLNLLFMKVVKGHWAHVVHFWKKALQHCVIPPQDA